jgi:hypothetical protein
MGAVMTTTILTFNGFWIKIQDAALFAVKPLAMPHIPVI